MIQNVPTGFGEISLQFRLTGDPEPIVLTCGFAADYADSPTAFEIAGQLSAAMAGAPAFRAVVSSQYTLFQIVVIINRGTAAAPDYETGVSTTNQPGTNSAAPLPQNTAWLLRKNTSMAGRRGKGRMYVPGIAEAVVTAIGQIQDDYLDDVQAAANALYTALNSAAGVLELCVLHSGEGPVTTIPEPTVITSFSPDQVVATQRRRLRR